MPLLCFFVAAASGYPSFSFTLFLSVCVCNSFGLTFTGGSPVGVCVRLRWQAEYSKQPVLDCRWQNRVLRGSNWHCVRPRDAHTAVLPCGCLLLFGPFLLLLCTLASCMTQRSTPSSSSMLVFAARWQRVNGLLLLFCVLALCKRPRGACTTVLACVHAQKSAEARLCC